MGFVHSRKLSCPIGGDWHRQHGALPDTGRAVVTDWPEIRRTEHGSLVLVLLSQFGLLLLAQESYFRVQQLDL
jgi:hypothetical protein